MADRELVSTRSSKDKRKKNKSKHKEKEKAKGNPDGHGTKKKRQTPPRAFSPSDTSAPPKRGAASSTAFLAARLDPDNASPSLPIAYPTEQQQQQQQDVPTFTASVVQDHHPLPIDKADMDQWCFPLVVPAMTHRIQFPPDAALAATYATVRHSLRSLLLVALGFRFTDVSDTEEGLMQLQEAYLASEVTLGLANTALERAYQCPSELCWACAYTPSGVVNRSWRVEIALTRYNMLVLSLQMAFHQNRYHRRHQACRVSSVEYTKLQLESKSIACLQQFQTLMGEWRDEHSQLQKRGMLPSPEALRVIEHLIGMLTLEWRIFHICLPAFRDSIATYNSTWNAIAPAVNVDSDLDEAARLSAIGLDDGDFLYYCRLLQTACEQGRQLTKLVFHEKKRFVGNESGAGGGGGLSAALWTSSSSSSGSSSKKRRKKDGKGSSSSSLWASIFRTKPSATANDYSAGGAYGGTSASAQVNDIALASQLFLTDLQCTQIVKYAMQSQYIYRLLYLILETSRASRVDDLADIAYCGEQFNSLFSVDPYMQLFINNLYDDTPVILKMKKERESLNLPTRDPNSLPKLPQYTSMPVATLQVDWAFSVWGLETFAQFHPALVAGIAEMAHNTRDMIARKWDRSIASTAIEKQYEPITVPTRAPHYVMSSEASDFIDQVLANGGGS